MFKFKLISTVIASIILAGCATPTPTTQFIVSDAKVWNLQDAPILSEVISTPIANVSELAKNIATQTFMATRKEKFETDEAYKARVEKSKQGYGTAFFVKPLSTYECTKYDFQKKIYSVACKAFRASDELDKDTKPTGKKTQLANAFTSREVEFFESNSYHISVATDARAELNISSDDAKKIDRDLMAGVLISISGAKLEVSGCSETSVQYDDKICKPLAFKSGAAFSNFKYTIEPEAILEAVIYQKSTNKVLSHKKYTLQK